MRIKEIIRSFAGDHIPAEIEYQTDNGKVIGYWAYGHFDPLLPYQGKELGPIRMFLREITLAILIGWHKIIWRMQKRKR